MDGPLPLLDFQEDGAKFLASRRHAFLADEMGVGKSAQAVRACDLVGANDILVLVPASARVNWLREFAKFSPMDRDAVAVLDGRTAPGAKGLTVCSYDLLMQPKVRKSLLARQWDAIISDEAHYLKGRTAGRTKAVYGRKCDGLTGLISRTPRFWRLSGTPAPNDASELWTHLHSACIYSGNWYDFVKEFCTGFTSDYGFRITGTKNAAKLKLLLADFLLRRKKEDVMPELPPLSFEHRTLDPSPVDYKAYFEEALARGGLPLLQAQIATQNQSVKLLWEGSRKSGHVLNGEALRALEAIAPSLGALRRWVGLSKVPEYLNVVRDELQSKRIDKLVVFAYNIDVIEAIRYGLRDFGAVSLYGGTPAAKRQKRIDEFQGDPRCRVFVGQLQAAGTALTLTAAHRVDILQESYVPGENAQAIMRCHRKGQLKPVLVRFFGLDRSIDLEISRAHMRKARELAKVFD